MQFTLLAAVVLALAQVQVSARPITSSVTYMTYATYYVDPWVVMQGERAASTVSTAAVSAATSVTNIAQSGIATAAEASSSSTVTTSSTITSSSTVTAFATEFTGSASKAATEAKDFATDDYMEANALYTARSMTRGKPAATSTEEEQYYYAQTQSAA